MAERANEVEEDLAAFAPVPAGVVRFGGVEYPVRAFNDLPIKDALRLLRIEQEGSTRVHALLLQIELLVPTLSTEYRQRLTMRQAREVAKAARQASATPGEGSRAAIRLGYWFAQLARFYSWTPEMIVERLTLRQMNRYLGFIGELSAQERLDQVAVTSMIHMERGSRQRLLSDWLAQAGVKSDEPEDDAKLLRGNDLRRFVGAPPLREN